jgi:hypothetical protein
MHIYFGEALDYSKIVQLDTEGKQLNEFNNQLRQQLKEFTYEIDPNDREKLKTVFFVKNHPIKTVLLVIPAVIGFLIHSVLYLAVVFFTKIFFDNDHYDSVVISLLALLYPLYSLLLAVIVFILFGWIAAVLILVLLPLSAWALVHVKHQMEFN